MLGLAAFWTIFAGPQPARAVPQTYVVRNPTESPGELTSLTLRQAIELANANEGADTIEFELPADDLVIDLESALPTITETVTIDGTTQPGYSDTPLVTVLGEVDEYGYPLYAGFVVQPGFEPSDPSVDGTAIRGLAIGNFSSAILDPGSTGSSYDNNYIGVAVDGETPIPNDTGISLGSEGESMATTVADNVISANFNQGVYIVSSGNVLTGNIIGLNAAGDSQFGPDDAFLGNSSGVGIDFGVDNVIGGTTAAARNIISGNGVGIYSSSGASATTIQGNYIGTDITGTVGRGNADGIELASNADQIGGTAAGAGNLISDNGDGEGGGHGIFLELPGSEGSRVEGNLIGTDATGMLALGNGTHGIEVEGPNVRIGGSAAGAGNTISANGSDGVFLDFADGAVIEGNLIGTTIEGTAGALDAEGFPTMGNEGDGIDIRGTNSAQIGGPTAAAGNVISGNSDDGITVRALFSDCEEGCETPSEFTSIQNNLIGVEASGTIAYPNGTGIELQSDTAFTTIGGYPTVGNVISGNDGNGIQDDGTKDVIKGNFIGTDRGGALDLGNVGDGVQIGSSDPEVGGFGPGDGNIIAFNDGDGVEIVFGTENPIVNNSIHDNVDLGINLVGGSEGFEEDGFGVNPNDLYDADEGPNDLQNYPVLVPGNSRVEGELFSEPDSDYAIHFYGNDACDPSGFGEGETPLGSTSVTTNADGFAEFTFLTAFDAAQPFITATATNLEVDKFNTSEFSECVKLEAPPTVSIGDPTELEGDSGTVLLNFPVTLEHATDVDVEIDYSTADGTASASSDYATTSGTLIIPADETSGTIAVSVAGDTVPELNETLFVDLTAARNATIADGRGDGTITNDDAAASIADLTQPEGSSGGTSLMSFTVTLDRALPVDTTVSYTTTAGTATAPSDYSTTAGSVIVPAGATTAPVDVPIVGDTLLETNESFFVDLTATNNGIISDSRGDGTITNDDAAPTIAISDGSLLEGNTSTSPMVFTVSLSAASGLDASVAYSTANATATSPADYTGISSAVTIPAGSTSATISVPIVGETLYEVNETFLVNLGTPTNATIGDGEGVGTITNDDSPPIGSVSDASVSEGSTGGTSSMVFTVTLNGPSGLPATFGYATADGSAAAPDDYAAASSTVTVPAGATTATIAVPVVGDTAFETDETLFVDLGEATNATVTDGRGVGTIINDDAAPGVSIADASVLEGNGGTTAMVFTITQSGAVGSDTTVAFTTANGTAVAPGDYTSTAGTATIPAGDTSTTATVPVVGDTASEPDETFTVTLSTPGDGDASPTFIIADGSAVGTITNDDNPPAVSVSDAGVIEGNSGFTPMTFTISLPQASAQDVSVAFATSNGSATAPGDYGAGSGTVTIPAGSTTATVVVSVVGDTTAEVNETFTVTLSSPTNATIADGTGVGTITNDDAPPPATTTTPPPTTTTLPPITTTTLPPPFQQPTTTTLPPTTTTEAPVIAPLNPEVNPTTTLRPVVTTRPPTVTTRTTLRPTTTSTPPTTAAPTTTSTAAPTTTTSTIPPPEFTLTALAPDGTGQGRPGVGLNINGEGYESCETVYFFFDGARIASDEPDSAGRVHPGEAEVPGDADPGSQPVISTCDDSGEPVRASTSFRVIEDSLHRSSLVTSGPKPSEIPLTLQRLANSAALAALLMLVFAFPSQLFNSTFEENYDEIRHWFPTPRRAIAAIAAIPNWIRTGGFFLIGGLVAAFLDPSIGFNLSTLGLVLGLAIAVVLVNLGFAAPRALYMRYQFGDRGEMRLLAGSILVGIVCVALSRALNFQPGYVYGLLAGFAFARQLDPRRHGRVTALTVVSVFIISMAAWFAWVPLSHAAEEPGAGLAVIAAEAALFGTFLYGLEALVIILLPLRFLAGSAVMAWSRTAWILMFGAATFGLIFVLLSPSTGYVGHSLAGSAVTMLIVAAAFMLFSIAFWAYFRLRPSRGTVQQIEF